MRARPGLDGRRAGKVTLVLCIGVSLFVYGCGVGGDDEPVVSTIPISQDSERSRTERPAAPKRGPARELDPPADRKPAAADSLGEVTRQVLDRLPPGQRKRVVTQVALALARAAGLRLADVEVPGVGRVVGVVVSRDSACSATPETADELAAKIRRAAPFVRSVRVTVEGNGGELSGYVAGRCQDVALPRGGRGRIVVARTGSGSATTRAFAIRSRRWTVEYANHGRFLQVIAEKGRFPHGEPFGTSRRRAGRQVLRGPGRFRLRIASGGRWAVRVRDGA